MSRTRYFVLAGLVAAGLGVGALIMWQYQRNTEETSVTPDHKVTTVVDTPAPPPAPPPVSDPAGDIARSATDLVAAGKTQQAIDSLLKARRVYPQSALLAVTLGKLYLGKMWWNDGLANARDAIKLDPKLREDAELQRLAVKGFITTPSYDDRLGRFLVDLGPSVVPVLEETAKSSRSPDIRARVESEIRKIH